MKITVNVMNAFINDGSGGNPAGVVINADHLNTQQKLLIANKVGLSETAFVSKSTSADFKLGFFTPQRQIAHCGHATVAVFSYLAQNGDIGEGWFSKETIEGNRKILIDGKSAFMEQKAPQYTPVEPLNNQILESLQLKSSQIIHPPFIVNTGNNFMIIGVQDKSILAKIKPLQKIIYNLSKDHGLVGYYVYTTDVFNKISDVTTRMFAPFYGIDEEAATGMAAGPMACFLFDKMNIKKSQFIIEQGYFMSSISASKIHVNLQLESTVIERLMAGGKANVSDTITVTI